MKKHLFLAAIPLLALSACDTPQIYPPTQRPDYSIRVLQTPNGSMTAIPPSCPSWSSSTTDPYDNQPLPQFGCATSRNLAMMVERPEDLLQGREMDNSSGVMAVGAMRRYYNNQTRGLIYLSAKPDTVADATTAPTASSNMSGDVTGSAASSSPSSGSGSSSAGGQ